MTLHERPSAYEQWLPAYQASWIRPDLVAGLTLAAYLLPAGIGDASLAGAAARGRGLYACLFSGLVFWLFCSSKQTVITVTSALSLLVAASVGELSVGDPAKHSALAACLAIMVAAIAFLAWAVRAGTAVNFFSGDGAGRLQGGPGALPRQHAAAQAVRVQGHARATSGSARRTSSHISATRTRRR
jgi:hypothetical protein